ncbi:amidase [Jiella mangrovi]|uniref:Indoleacetamide hydrolase n=1 Tax=Jiella mangrovi TaxID=2821407 RepID=A0ABS4BCX5_9HYPH|nr:amidase [Jiella mangrovi]MBP0614594.1 amidase [Jiella mangrovi]
MTEPLDWTLIEAAAAIRAGDISSAELTDLAIQRAEALQTKLNSFIALEPEAARSAAKAADEALASGRAVGPIHGVPLSHKDMYDRAGAITGCGSKIRAHEVAAHTATVIERLDEAGQIHLGRLNMSEFAMGPTGFNAHHGRASNPLDPARIAGGSSSGSGSAVGSNTIFAALGSDTGGSIRLPAACCGVVGLKPTQGRVSRFGAMPLSHSLDCVGPLARSVADAKLITRIIAGPDGRDGACLDAPPIGAEAPAVADLTVAIPDAGFFVEDLAPEVAAFLADAEAILTGAGARIVRPKLPPLDDVIELTNLIAMTEAGAIHLDTMRERPEDYGEQVRARLIQGLGVPAPVYLRAMQIKGVFLRRFLAEVLTECDAVVTPTMPMLPPVSAEVEVGASEAMTRVMVSISKFTRVFSFLGLPTLAVPGPATTGGLKPSVQIAAAPFREDITCTLGEAIERGL